jgi:hypothetical protein
MKDRWLAIVQVEGRIIKTSLPSFRGRSLTKRCPADPDNSASEIWATWSSGPYLQTFGMRESLKRPCLSVDTRLDDI